MKKLKIAQVAPLWFPVPPKKYGGTERIISYLTEELVKRGHNVTLFASGDSKTEAKLFSITQKSLFEKGILWGNWHWNNLNHSIAFERAEKFDIIHCHWVILGANFQRFVKTPVIHTLHNIPDPDSTAWEVYKYYRNDLQAIYVSNSEMKDSLVKVKHSYVVYNGIDISDLKFHKKGGDILVWSGRIRRDKGPDKAIKIAQKIKRKLLLAGKVQEVAEDKLFFKESIKPNLNDKIRYIGEIEQKQFSSFFGNAKALIFPLRWEEPFGLIVAEANACGTPVITYARGAMPELIQDGFNGFLVKPDDINGMVKAVRKVYDLPENEYQKIRLNCRKHVEDNFTVEKMVDGYEKVYQQILDKNKK